MSGHSKWSTIKRKKEATDIARGKLFSKLSKAISIAVKTGGGDDPDANAKLRMAIDTAKAANMPKENIERAVKRASGTGEDLEEVTYEGFGPSGMAVMVEVATDNRNRTGQEIKNIFENNGGNLGGPGSVAFNFEPRGQLVVNKKSDVQEQILSLMDTGAEDIEETHEGIEVYSQPTKLNEVSQKVKELGFEITSSGLIQKPKNQTSVDDAKKAAKALSFLEKLEDHDDVQQVFANLDIPEPILKSIQDE